MDPNAKPVYKAIIGHFFLPKKMEIWVHTLNEEGSSEGDPEAADPEPLL